MAKQAFNFDTIEGDELPPVIDTPIEEIKPVEKSTATSDDLSSLFAGYNDVTPKTLPFNNEGGAAPQLQAVNGLTYKTGKKAGQPRKPRMTYTPDQNPASLGGEILTGALMLTLVDLLFPLIITAINNRFSKDKMKVKDLELSAKQKSEIAPIADRVLKQINFNANPTALLIFSIVGIYATNYAIAKMLTPTKLNDNEKK